MTPGGFVDQFLAGYAKTDLHRGVPVGVVALELGDAAGTGLDQGDGDRSALLVEELGHTQFLPENADGHRWEVTPARTTNIRSPGRGMKADECDAVMFRDRVPGGIRTEWS